MKKSVKTSLIIIPLALVACLAWLGSRPAEPVEPVGESVPGTSRGPSFEVRNFPRFPPEIFAQVRPREPSMSKGFGKGLAQLGEEGVVQIFWPRTGAREPILGAVGELQLEVFTYRMQDEYGVELRLDRKPWTRARWLVNVSRELIDLLPGVVNDESGRPVALFHSDFEIGYALERYEGLELHDRPPAEETKV